MNEVVLNKKEQEIVILVIDEILRRDSETINSMSSEAKSLYYKCGGKL